VKAPQIVPFRPSFAWYSIGQRHGQVHSRSRLPCVTVAPNGYKEQLLRSTTLFIILVKCGNCIHRRVTCPDDLLVENRGTGESLDYHITHSSLVKDPLPDSDPANRTKQISLSRWHASGGFLSSRQVRKTHASFRGLSWTLAVSRELPCEGFNSAGSAGFCLLEAVGQPMTP